jgi:hypothetical protein
MDDAESSSIASRRLSYKSYKKITIETADMKDQAVL